VDERGAALEGLVERGRVGEVGLFFCRGGGKRERKREEEEVPRESSKGASKIAWGKNPSILVSLSSLSLIFISLTLNSFSFSLDPGSAHRCAFLAALEGSRTVPRTEWPAARRRATMDDAR